MTDHNWHKLHPDAYDDARLEAHGAIAGWMYGNGQTPPKLNPVLIEAYNRAFAAAFNAGYEAAAKEATQ